MNEPQHQDDRPTAGRAGEPGAAHGSHEHGHGHAHSHSHSHHNGFSRLLRAALTEHGRRTIARVRVSCIPLMVAMFLLLGFSWALDQPGQPVRPWVITLYAAVPLLGVLLITNRTWAIGAFMLLVASNAALFVSPALAGEEGMMSWPGKLLVLYYALVIVALVRAVFLGRGEVRDRVYGGVAVFLMFGILCAIFYRQMIAMDPQAIVPNISDNLGGHQLNWNSCIYFSFVTLATIGFGDYVPGNGMARSLAMIEGLIGVLYPAVLLARLVTRDDRPRV
ncbi:MAG: potassium channel family protein [Phycisphaerales bacterium]